MSWWSRSSARVRPSAEAHVSQWPPSRAMPASATKVWACSAALARSQAARRARASGNFVAILILTAKDEEADVVRGLEEGADDYLTKPFSFSELLARVQALIRRATGAKDATRLVVGDLSRDLLKREVLRAGEKIELQPREFSLLEYLMRHAGQVVTRTMLLEGVWDYHFDPQTNVIDVHVRQIRKKLGSCGEQCIETVRGVGYRFHE